MLARMGSLLELNANKPKSETLHNLKGMETARQALIKFLTERLLRLNANKPKSETLHNLKGMETARQALIKDRTAATARLTTATHPLLKKQANYTLEAD